MDDGDDDHNPPIIALGTFLSASQSVNNSVAGTTRPTTTPFEAFYRPPPNRLHRSIVLFLLLLLQQKTKINDLYVIPIKATDRKTKPGHHNDVSLNTDSQFKGSAESPVKQPKLQYQSKWDQNLCPYLLYKCVSSSPVYCIGHYHHLYQHGLV